VPKESKEKQVKKAPPRKIKKAANVVGRVMKGKGAQDVSKANLFNELESLAAFIQEARDEIASLSPQEVKEEFLPTASDELDAIIEATEDATHAIMDATDLVEAVISRTSGEDQKTLTDAITAIYEACTFQDITGQRISKVVKTLSAIEDKVDGLLVAFDDKENHSGTRESKKPKKKDVADEKVISDEDLLNGPQSSDKAKSQEEIDALLASFD